MEMPRVRRNTGDALLMNTEVPNSCPHYMYKAKENKVLPCGGTVVFLDGASVGVCQSCKKEVPIILEM